MSIAALIEAVEAGTATTRDFIDAFGGIPMGNDIEAYNAYNGSLDAAMALHEALLPGYGWGVGPWGARVWLYSDRPEWDRPIMQEVEMAFDPARAWLLAILRAKEAGQ